MACFKNYTCKAVSVAFISTISYVMLFLVLKVAQQNFWLIILNLVYAIFVFVTVYYDRKSKFATAHNAKLVTLGTALAPVAAGITDAVLTMMYSYPSAEWPKVIYFGLIAFGIWICLILISWLIPTR